MSDIIADLEAVFNRVGAEKIWKKKIGGITLWFSPITLAGQEKVTEIMSNPASLGVNLVFETKRVSLSNGIVGINDIDLRPYREGIPSLPITGRDGRPVKVSLDKYIYHKLSGWSAQLVDDAFNVYTDVLESHQKENLQGVVFENAKDPEIELYELEARVQEIREKLRKPRLVEESKGDDVAGDEFESQVSEPYQERRERINIVAPDITPKSEPSEDSSFLDPYELEASMQEEVKYVDNPRMVR